VGHEHGQLFDCRDNLVVYSARVRFCECRNEDEQESPNISADTTSKQLRLIGDEKLRRSERQNGLRALFARCDFLCHCCRMKEKLGSQHGHKEGSTQAQLVQPRPPGRTTITRTFLGKGRTFEQCHTQLVKVALGQCLSVELAHENHKALHRLSLRVSGRDGHGDLGSALLLNSVLSMHRTFESGANNSRTESNFFEKVLHF